MIVVKTLMCILVLLIAPLCMGLIPACFMKRPVTGLLMPLGYLTGLCAFEVVCIPLVLFTRGRNFPYLVATYTPILILLCAAGLALGWRKGIFAHIRSDIARAWETVRREPVIWILCAVILIVIFVFMETRVIFDGDDAYYVTQSVAAWQNGTMYATNPYTGRAAAIDYRHALAVFTMWIAYVGRICGIHPTILCHSVLPLVLVPLALIVWGNMGAMLLRDRREDLAYYMLFMEIMILFGRVSIYTPESFLTARIWQGKAVAACILLPAVFLAYTRLYEEKGAECADGGSRIGEWVFLCLIDASAGIFSSLAVELVSVIIFTGGAVLAVIRRSFRDMIASACCCIPGIIYMTGYLYFAFLTWR